MYSPRKIMLLQMMGRPFLEVEGAELNTMLVETAFAARLIEEDEPLPEQFSGLEDPAEFINSMQNDLVRELILRN